MKTRKRSAALAPERENSARTGVDVLRMLAEAQQRLNLPVPDLKGALWRLIDAAGTVMELTGQAAKGTGFGYEITTRAERQAREARKDEPRP